MASQQDRRPTPQQAQQTLDRVKQSPSQKVKLAIVDIDGVLRGKYVHKDKFLSAVEGGLGFCSVVFGWDSGDVCYDNARFTGWHTGYPDALARIDLSTYREVPWDNQVPFFLADFESPGGQPLGICPRQTLKRVIERLAQAGYSALTSLEYEWFNFHETSQTLADKGYQAPQPLTPGMFGYSILRMNQNHPFLNALFDEMAAFRVPIEGLHTETGPGVFEAAILYDHALEAADRAVLFKTGAKEIGHRFGIMPTFMAKWSAELPGCSGHVHQSLWTRDKDGNLGKNVFHDPARPHGMSELFESYIAGQLQLMPELLPFYAPTVNSYKRLTEGAWAPTRANWGVDNRTTALRAIPGGPKSTRLETRVNGSDTNPYLSLAAALASGLHGIERGLKLPRGAVEGNGYADQAAPTLPRNLDEATRRLEESTVARELLGPDLVEHFVQSRKWEWKQWNRAVTNWELQRYFEII
jgi:glutamine synthetase